MPSKLFANPKIIFVPQGQTYGSSMIKYEKNKNEVIYYRIDGSPWKLKDVSILTPSNPDFSDEYHWNGSYTIELKPGMIYEAAIYAEEFSPSSTDPFVIDEIQIYCLWEHPQSRNLITDQNRESGGTWHAHRIHTNVPTRIVSMGVSRNIHTYDTNGLPILNADETFYSDPINLKDDHFVEFNSLLPGHRYYFTAMVSDSNGNWEVILNEEFFTLFRKLTIEFIKLHIYNDGDPFGHGKAKFHFSIKEGDSVIQNYYLPYLDIDDWGETDRPYTIYFQYSGPAKSLENTHVFVRAIGTEEDGIFENDEVAGFIFKEIQLPKGRNVENVANKIFLLDCPPATVGDDFHFGVEVRWTVQYVS